LYFCHWSIRFTERATCLSLHSCNQRLGKELSWAYQTPLLFLLNKVGSTSQSRLFLSLSSLLPNAPLHSIKNGMKILLPISWSIQRGFNWIYMQMVPLWSLLRFNQENEYFPCFGIALCSPLHGNFDSVYRLSSFIFSAVIFFINWSLLSRALHHPEAE